MPFVLESDEHGDEFQRGSLAREMTLSLLDHDISRLPLNVGIFGSWGTGKTQFMHMIRDLVAESPVGQTKIVWFDPWKYESRQDVRTGLMFAMLHAIEESESSSEELKSHAAATRRMIGKVFFKSARNALNVMSFINLGSSIEDSWNETMQEEADVQNSVDHALDEFHDLISTWVGEQGRCFVFVDDLDRCLPDQMISLVEALHLFMAELPCCFTVGMDRDAIESALTNRYPNLKAEQGKQYLDKIFPVSINLSPPTTEQLLSRYRQFISSEQIARSQAEFMVVSLELNPRAIERFLNNYSLARMMLKSKPQIYQTKESDLMVLLTVIRTRFPAMFDAMQQVPRSAITFFARDTKAGNLDRLSTDLDSTGGSALLAFAAEGTETRGFMRSLPVTWQNLLEKADHLKELMAFADLPQS